MSDQKPSISGTGSILPAGTLPVIALEGAPSELTVEIESFSNADGNDMVKCVYPDGFVKHHQASTVEDLLGKVSNQLRGRYGVSTFEVDSLPDGLLPGQSFNFKGVTYGT